MKKTSSIPLSEVTVEAPDSRQLAKKEGGITDDLKGFSLVSHLDGLNGTAVIQWLERAVPAYETSRTQTTLMGLSIGYALLIVRDFSPRGTLTAIKKMQSFGRSSRTLDRCIKLAQNFITAKGLADEKSGKLAKPADAPAFFQSELDLGSGSNALTNPLFADMAAFVGESTMAELLDSDLLGEDDSPMPPNGHQKDAAKNRTKETPEGIRREAFKRAFKTFSKSFHAHEWTCLYQRGAPDLVKTGLDVGALELEEFLTKALAAVSAHNKEAANKERSKKGGKSC